MGSRKSDFAQSVEKIKEAIASLKAKGEPLPTLFEAETAMAFCIFGNALRHGRT